MGMTNTLTDRERELLTHNHYMPYNLQHWTISVVTNPTPSTLQIETARQILKLTSRQRHNYVVLNDRLIEKPKIKTINLKR